MAVLSLVVLSAYAIDTSALEPPPPCEAPWIGAVMPEAPTDLAGDGPAVLLVSARYRPTELETLAPALQLAEDEAAPVLATLNLHESENGPRQAQPILAGWYRATEELPAPGAFLALDDDGEVFATVRSLDPSAATATADLDIDARIMADESAMEAAPRLDLFYRYGLLVTAAVPAVFGDLGEAPATWALRLGYDDAPPEVADVFDADTHIVFSRDDEILIHLPIGWFEACVSGAGLGDWTERQTLHLLTWPLGADPHTQALRGTIDLSSLRDQGRATAREFCDQQGGPIYYPSCAEFPSADPPDVDGGEVDDEINGRCAALPGRQPGSPAMLMVLAMVALGFRLRKPHR